jgi:glutathione synthase/RimK-type ligase-like ATP-grasp enzyme
MALSDLPVHRVYRCRYGPDQQIVRRDARQRSIFVGEDVCVAIGMDSDSFHTNLRNVLTFEPTDLPKAVRWNAVTEAARAGVS